MMDAFMNDPTEPRTSLLLPPSSFSYFIFTFLDRRKSANLWVIRPLCRVEAHTESAEGSRLIERYGGPPTAYAARRGRTFPFRTPSVSPSARLGSARFLPPRRKRAEWLFPMSFRTELLVRALLLFPPLQRDFRSSWGRGQGDFEVSASNKNLGQIGRIVQFYLPRCPPRERVKTFTFCSLRRLILRLLIVASRDAPRRIIRGELIVNWWLCMD